MEKRQAKRVTRELTQEELEQLKRDRALIAEELPELIELNQRRKDAADEDTLSGELRRAVHASDSSPSSIAAKIGIPPLLLDEFLTGERTLRSDVMDRLAAVLGYKPSKLAQSRND